jgi:hypothetical protein
MPYRVPSHGAPPDGTLTAHGRRPRADAGSAAGRPPPAAAVHR